jgi:pyruvate formate lyase activating enzyme
MSAPLLLEIKASSLDDGPGIRSVVFFKGCPLACDWCHNPEAGSALAELSFDPKACVGARDCLAVCAPRALDPARPGFVDRERCTRCFACVDACPSGAFERVGRAASVEEIVERLARYAPFHASSGGGVTLSGGEPTLHAELCGELAAALHARGTHVLLETCGHFELESYLARIDPFVDQIYFDLKILGDEAHRRFCGTSNARALANLRALVARANRGETNVLPRIALIPERTATDENLAAAGAFLRAIGAPRVALLEYNPLWHEKARKLGGEPRYARATWMSAEEKARARGWFGGIEVV